MEPTPAPVVVAGVMRRHLREQPVLHLEELWDPTDPSSGAGQALAAVFAEVEQQGLALAGTVYICMAPATADGMIPGDAVIPVDRCGAARGRVAAQTLPATEAISTLYRDDIHLTSGAAIVRRLREYAQAEELALDGHPRWVYHTDPSWNLEPDDQLIEVLWPYH